MKNTTLSYKRHRSASENTRKKTRFRGGKMERPINVGTGRYCLRKKQYSTAVSNVRACVPINKTYVLRRNHVGL